MNKRTSSYLLFPIALYLIVSLLAVGCSSDGNNAPQPDGIGAPPDGAPAVDTTVPGPDSGLPVADIGAPVADTAPVTDTAAPVTDTAAPVTDTAQPTDPGPVMCRRDEDCGGNGLTCLKHIPGGHCSGCGTDSSLCPTGTKCFQGICVRKCTKASDCNVGLRCLGTSHCAGKGCAGPGGCPAMYPCEYPLCERARCDQGEACPFPMVCDGEWCMEP